MTNEARDEQNGDQRMTVIPGRVTPAETITRPGGEVVVITQEQRDLIRRTIAPDATDDQMSLFLAFAKRSGLDPLTRQVYAIFDNSGRMSIVTSIDGMRLAAARTNEYAGSTQPEWCGTDGLWHEVWLLDNPPAAAKVGVRRRNNVGDVDTTFRVATWKEFAKPNRDNWKNMPSHMLAVRAESHALRALFPNELGGIYTEDEITDNIPSGEQRQSGGNTTSAPANSAPRGNAPARGNRAGTSTRQAPSTRQEPAPPKSRAQIDADEELKALGNWIREGNISNPQVGAFIGITDKPITLDILRDWMAERQMGVAAFKTALTDAVKNPEGRADRSDEPAPEGDDDGQMTLGEAL